MQMKQEIVAGGKSAGEGRTKAKMSSFLRKKLNFARGNYGRAMPNMEIPDHPANRKA
jgi:hypothetical protein